MSFAHPTIDRGGFRIPIGGGTNCLGVGQHTIFQKKKNCIKLRQFCLGGAGDIPLDPPMIDTCSLVNSQHVLIRVTPVIRSKVAEKLAI